MATAAQVKALQAALQEVLDDLGNTSKIDTADPDELARRIAYGLKYAKARAPNPARDARADAAIKAATGKP